MQIGKEKVKLSHFADDMIQYIENPKDTIKNYESSSVNLVKSQVTKLIQKSVALLYATMKEKLSKQSHLPLQQKE